MPEVYQGPASNVPMVMLGGGQLVPISGNGMNTMPSNTPAWWWAQQAALNNPGGNTISPDNNPVLPPDPPPAIGPPGIQPIGPPTLPPVHDRPRPNWPKLGPAPGYIAGGGAKSALAPKQGIGSGAPPIPMARSTFTVPPMGPGIGHTIPGPQGPGQTPGAAAPPPPGQGTPTSSPLQNSNRPGYPGNAASNNPGWDAWNNWQNNPQNGYQQIGPPGANNQQGAQQKGPMPNLGDMGFGVPPYGMGGMMPFMNPYGYGYGMNPYGYGMMGMQNPYMGGWGGSGGMGMMGPMNGAGKGPSPAMNMGGSFYNPMMAQLQQLLGRDPRYLDTTPSDAAGFYGSGGYGRSSRANDGGG